MTLRILGAALIIVGCGSFGQMIAFSKQNEIRTLRELMAILERFEWELQYRITPLPELCRIASEHTKGVLKQLFCTLAEELEKQIAPNVEVCMSAAINRTAHIPALTINCVKLLGQSLGNYELDGQLRGITSVRSECTRVLQAFSKDIETRIRYYRTLSLCVGTAIAILFI